jgi:hypothetical protein
LQQPVELSVFLTVLLDLVDRVQYGRMVLVPKLSPNLRQGHPGDFLGQIHADLSGHCDGFGVVPGFQILHAHSVVIRDRLLNHFDRYRLFIAVKDFA